MRATRRANRRGLSNETRGMDCKNVTVGQARRPRRARRPGDTPRRYGSPRAPGRTPGSRTKFRPADTSGQPVHPCLLVALLHRQAAKAYKAGAGVSQWQSRGLQNRLREFDPLHPCQTLTPARPDTYLLATVKASLPCRAVLLLSSLAPLRPQTPERGQFVGKSSRHRPLGTLKTRPKPDNPCPNRACRLKVANIRQTGRPWPIRTSLKS